MRPLSGNDASPKRFSIEDERRKSDMRKEHRHYSPHSAFGKHKRNMSGLPRNAISFYQMKKGLRFRGNSRQMSHERGLSAGNRLEHGRAARSVGMLTAYGELNRHHAARQSQPTSHINEVDLTMAEEMTATSGIARSKVGSATKKKRQLSRAHRLANGNFSQRLSTAGPLSDNIGMQPPLNKTLSAATHNTRGTSATPKNITK
jgi:hypothetical protein